jgi:hypothetical protein
MLRERKRPNRSFLDFGQRRALFVFVVHETEGKGGAKELEAFCLRRIF